MQHLCRTNIRSVLRGHVDVEHPNLKLKQLKKERRPRRQVRRIVIPFYDESDMSNSNSDGNTDIEYDSDGPEYTISSRLPSRMSVFLEDFLRRHAELQLLRDMEEQMSHSNSSSSDSEEPGPNVPPALPNANEVSGNGNEINDRDSDELFSVITVSNITQSTSSDESSNFMQPPSQSTRSRRKKRLLKKRKRASSDSSNNKKSKSAAGTSTEGTAREGSGEPRKKVKRTAATVVWKKLIDPEKSQSQEEASDTENYSEFLVAKIGALPLPSLILRYLNYKRDNL